MRVWAMRTRRSLRHPKTVSSCPLPLLVLAAMTVLAVAAGAVAEEEDSLALPTEMLWQPAAEKERRVPLRMERHVLWPADLVV